MMKRKCFLFVLFVSLNIFAEEIGVIKGFVRLSRIYIDGEKIYVSDDYKIKIFSIKNLSLEKEIGRKGEGPGEFNMNPRLFFPKDSVFVWTTRKIIWFNKEGEFLKGNRIPYLFLKTLPINENFLTLKTGEYYKISLFNKDFKLIKDLLEYKFQFSMDKFNSLQVIMNFEVENDKVFVGKADENLSKVFDDKGNNVKVIRTSLPRFKMEDWFKEEAIEGFKKSGIKLLADLEFPEFFPFFRTFYLDNNKIYFLTFEKERDSYLYIIVNMDRKEINRIFFERR